MRGKVHFVWLGVGFSALIFFLAGINLVGQANSVAAFDSISEDERQWVDAIRTSGPAEAYEAFVLSVEGMTPLSQHGKAHAFGAALFFTNSSLSVCDDRFSYACFHEYVGRSILERGPGVVTDMYKQCSSILEEKATFCEHSIGHGIVSYLGYERGDLIEALGLCQKISGYRGLCYQGAFMEHNQRTMADGAPREADDLHDLCRDDHVPQQSVCAFWLPAWWHAVLKAKGTASEGMFYSLGALCGEFKNEERNRSCFAGIGKVTLVVGDYSPGKSKELCELTSRDLDEVVACKTGAAYFVSALDGGYKRASAVCSGLAGEERKTCDIFARKEQYPMVVEG